MSEDVLRELRTLKDQAEYLLKRYPQTRNNDFYLQLMWMKIFGGIEIPFIDWKIIKAIHGKVRDVPRVRRRIQNDEGRLLPTDPVVLRKRAERSEAMRRAIRHV